MIAVTSFNAIDYNYDYFSKIKTAVDFAYDYSKTLIDCNLITITDYDPTLFTIDIFCSLTWMDAIKTMHLNYIY